MRNKRRDVSPVICKSYRELGNELDVTFENGKPHKLDIVNDPTINEEKTALKSEKDKDKDKLPPVNFFALFRFANAVEIFLIVLGILSSWVCSLGMPGLMILFGRFTNTLVDHGGQSNMDQCLNMSEANHSIITFPTVTDEDFQQSINTFGLGMAATGLTMLVLSYIMVASLNSAAERQVYRIRSLFLTSVLKQDIGWYDTYPTGEFASRTAEDLAKLQEGIGEKVVMFNFFFATFLTCIITAFFHGWELTLVMLSVSPIIVIAMAVIGKVQANLAEDELKAYASAGSLVEEVLTAVRTVVAFGGEEKEVRRYEENLIPATKSGIKRSFLTALGGGTLWFIIFGSYTLAYWYGVKLILDESSGYSPSDMIIVFCCVLTGAMNMGQSAPYLEAFAQARAAAASIFDVINRVPPIDSYSSEGLTPREVTGNIEFENVHFNYPSRPEIRILNGMSIKINKGETVALVGESGCGKSTAIQLLQRFYDPASGTVSVDGNDIRDLNVGWLRNHIGVVGQEPVLFGTTIAENIKYGLEGATQEDIERACKQANAHYFIKKLPKQYDTLVGDRGTQLSGGQKQRIAIARALIKNPKILLLDEATSALDSDSESIVQAALDKAREGRTTIIIAHRLSTIRNADKIATFSEGRIVELGTHDELMAKNGIYYMLITTQTQNNNAEETDSELLESNKVVAPTRPLLEYQRSLSIRSDTSYEELTQGASTFLKRTPSLGKMKSTSLLSQELVDKDDELTPSFMKVLRYSKPEWRYILLGSLGAIGMGFSTPASAFLFGEIMGVLSYCDKDEASSESLFYALLFLVIGLATGVTNFIQIFMLGIGGEYLTKRLRKGTFATMLKQEMAWFDEPGNSVGVLCTRLSADAASVQGASGSRLGTILQSVCTLGASIIISMFLLWKMALLSVAFIPLVLVSTYLQSKIIMGQSVIEMASLDKANKIAIESISNIRTVASLHIEKKIHEVYMNFLRGPHVSAIKSSHVRGATFGFAQSIPFFAYGASMYYGGYLVLNEDASYSSIIKVSELLIFGTMMVGQALAFAPNFNKGVVSASRIFRLLERKPLIDSSPDSGLRLGDDTPGKIVFNKVKFHYSTRPDVPVLRGLNLTVEPGQVVALVGGSGCGKSTCIQLLERFYDPGSGSMTIDGSNVTKLNVRWLRSRIGIVSQEPILFDRSIADNIAYGDNEREVSMEEVIEAAKDANIHNFISALPQGYETSVGNKGSQLSGGQKQRVAIARALVRKPKILLLDEATSALDNESEKIVQEALEKAQQGRTCITVAHRLSTIKNAHQINVIHMGKVVEVGNHEELIEKKGHYYRFYETQSRGHQ